MSRRKKQSYSRPGGYFTLDRGVYRSAQFLQLKKIQKLALVHLTSYFIPQRQEEIGMSSRRLAREIGVSKDSAAQALRGLVRSGFIQIIDESSWFDGKSRSYRLTFKPYKGRAPTDEWSTLANEGPDFSDHQSSPVGRLEQVGVHVTLKRHEG